MPDSPVAPSIFGGGPAAANKSSNSLASILIFSSVNFSLKSNDQLCAFKIDHSICNLPHRVGNFTIGDLSPNKSSHLLARLNLFLRRQSVGSGGARGRRWTRRTSTWWWGWRRRASSSSWRWGWGWRASFLDSAARRWRWRWCSRIAGRRWRWRCSTIGLCICTRDLTRSTFCCRTFRAKLNIARVTVYRLYLLALDANDSIPPVRPGPAFFALSNSIFNRSFSNVSSLTFCSSESIRFRYSLSLPQIVRRALYYALLDVFTCSL